MKKRASFYIFLLIAAFVLMGSVGVFAESDTPPVSEEKPPVSEEEKPPVEVISTFFNDPYAASQWSLGVINIENCWRYYTLGSKDIVVCVIDSGFYYDHVDAQKNFVKGNNYVEDKEVNPGIDDTSHGTSVAGVIGATSDNGIGITGLLYDVTVVSHKAYYWDAEQQKKIADPEDIAQAIRDSVDQYQADVINMSFLFETDEPVIREACEYAASKGVILVAAAGNNGAEGSAFLYPASYDCVIGVGSVAQNPDGSLSPAWNSARNGSVFCCAPGAGIRTLKNPLSKEDTEINEYRVVSGTSLATPHVASLAAMALAYKPDLDADTFRELLKKSCVDLGNKGYDTSYGYGLIDFEKMMRLLDGNVFDDVAKNDWFHNAAVSVFNKGLMYGVDDTHFAPERNLTRGMFVTILYRMDGAPGCDAEIPFTDLPEGMYYNEPIAWAFANKVAMGTGDTTFAPDEPINREQVVTMLYRYYTDYKKSPLPDLGGNADFRDTEDISVWAQDAVSAMVKAGVLAGVEYEDENGKYFKFLPANIATRAQAAKIISGLQFEE